MRLLCAILCLLAGGCAIGPGPDSSPVFTDLAGITRRPLESEQKLGSVLIFYWQDCPISNGYAPEINRIFAAYPNFAFYVVQVDPDLSPEAAKQHAKEYALQPPILLDPQHRLVKLAGATVTPETAVFGPRRELLYRGRIDDIYAAPGKKRSAPTQHDLRDALDAITAGHPIKIKRTKAVGCWIETQLHPTEGPLVPQSRQGRNPFRP